GEVVEQGVDLRAEEVRRRVVDRRHAARVLRGERRDHADAVGSQRHEGLQVGLDAGAAARVRAGDGKDDGTSPDRCVVILQRHSPQSTDIRPYQGLTACCILAILWSANHSALDKPESPRGMPVKTANLFKGVAGLLLTLPFSFSAAAFDVAEAGDLRASVAQALSGEQTL